MTTHTDRQSAEESCLQLSLFPDTASSAVVSEPRHPHDQFRSAISPAWWPFLHPMLQDGGWTIVRCREVDGVLDLEAVCRDGSPLSDADMRWIDSVRERLAQTCGSCGAQQARPRRLRIDTATHVLCDRCAGRVREGESLLAVASDFWLLDGTRRMKPYPAATSSAGVEAHGGGTNARAQGTAARRPCTELPPDELRSLVVDIRARMLRDVVGQDDAVARLALCAALHVGGGLTRGARLLVLGPTGVGKSTLALSMVTALSDAGWDVRTVMVDAVDLTSPGWQGASIGDVIEAALGGDDPASLRARRAVVIIDELHHVGVVRGLEGNMLAKRQEVVSSILGLFGHGSTLLGDSTRAWSSREAMVLGMGAFTGLLDTSRLPSISDLSRAGIPPELATRFQEVVRLAPLPEPRLRELLRAWPALVDLTQLCERLGYRVRIHDEAVAHAARLVTLGAGGSSPRTAGGWLVAALRTALIAAMDAPAGELVVTPDALPVPPTVARRPPDDERPPGDWDMTVVLTPR